MHLSQFSLKIIFMFFFNIGGYASPITHTYNGPKETLGGYSSLLIVFLS